MFQKKAPHLAFHPSIQFQIGDVRNFDFPKGDFSHVIHAATSANAKLNDQDPLLMFDTIVQGTRHTLDFAVHCNAKKFLLTSSGAVYGKQPPEMSHIPEDYCGAPDPTDPISAYGEGKRAAELLCALYSKKHGIETKMARCFAFVGPYLPLNIHYAIGNFIRDGLNGGPIVVKGDGTPYRSYLYAADLAIWLWTILFRGLSGQPYNVGSEDAISIKNIAYQAAASFPNPPRIFIAKSHAPSRIADRYIPSIKKAKDVFELNSWINLKEALDKTIKWNQ
jgi:dTDP-glucose 4,6-dehydratase